MRVVFPSALGSTAEEPAPRPSLLEQRPSLEGSAAFSATIQTYTVNILISLRHHATSRLAEAPAAVNH